MLTTLADLLTPRRTRPEANRVWLGITTMEQRIVPAALALVQPAPALVQTYTAPGSTRMFNPQPEPPADVRGIIVVGGRVAPGSTRMFNPQPEPPADAQGFIGTAGQVTPGSTRMFNPQPDPPAGLEGAIFVGG